jgi:hypothetical protein
VSFSLSKDRAKLTANAQDARTHRLYLAIPDLELGPGSRCPNHHRPRRWDEAPSPSLEEAVKEAQGGTAPLGSGPPPGSRQPRHGANCLWRSCHWLHHWSRRCQRGRRRLLGATPQTRARGSGCAHSCGADAGGTLRWSWA